MKKVIIMDIDGTLTNEDKIISENTKNKLKELQSQGAVLVLASGRPTRGLMQFAKELEMDKHNGLLVSFNGARVTDCETGDILFDQTMTVDTCKAVLNHMKNFDVIPMVYKGEYLHVTDVYNNIVHAYGRELNIIHYESRLCNYKLCEVDDLEEFADFPMNKILTAGEPDYLQENYKKMMEPLRIYC